MFAKAILLACFSLSFKSGLSFFNCLTCSSNSDSETPKVFNSSFKASLKLTTLLSAAPNLSANALSLSSRVIDSSDIPANNFVKSCPDPANAASSSLFNPDNADSAPDLSEKSFKLSFKIDSCNPPLCKVSFKFLFSDNACLSISALSSSSDIPP